MNTRIRDTSMIALHHPLQHIMSMVLGNIISTQITMGTFAEVITMNVTKNCIEKQQQQQLTQRLCK